MLLINSITTEIVVQVFQGYDPGPPGFTSAAIATSLAAPVLNLVAVREWLRHYLGSAGLLAAGSGGPRDFNRLGPGDTDVEEQVRQLRTEVVGLKEELYGKLNATRGDTCLCGERLRWLLIVVAVGLASSLFVLCWSCYRGHVGAERDVPSQRGRPQRKGLGLVR